MRANLEERWPEWRQLELTEYIQAFKASSDRARYIIYINAVVSLLIFISSWNAVPWSWSGRKIATAERYMREEYAAEYSQMHPRSEAAPRAAKTSAEWKARQLAFVEGRLRAARAKEYREAALQRTWFIPVPGLGIDVDVRDLGLLGGLTLLVLAVLLCLAMVRQHENLYLALFKVRRLRERERQGGHDGESMANFLYHALAMGQVLNYPPTLARWQYGIRNQLAGTVRWTILLIPALVHAVVVSTNLLAFDIRAELNGPAYATRLAVQSGLFLAILCACLIAAFYSRACNYRWRSAFDLVNPGLREVEPRSWREWLRIGRSTDIGPPYLLSELTYSLQSNEVVPTPAECVAKAIVKVQDEPPRVGQSQLIEMARKIREDAAAQIGDMSGVTFETWEATRNVIIGNIWFAEVKCRYQKTPRGEELQQSSSTGRA